MVPFGASLMVQVIKNLPAMQEIQVDPWDGKIPLEKEMATHFLLHFLSNSQFFLDFITFNCWCLDTRSLPYAE